MSLIDQLKEGLNDNSPILAFPGYKLEKELGSGQQGIVFLGRNNINKFFAIKFYHPTDTDPAILTNSIKNFISEVNILANLNHRNIVRIFTAGTAVWKDGKWQSKEGFENEITSIGANEVLFYIMDYIKGSDLSDIFPELFNKMYGGSLYRPELFENMIKQVCSAMSYYHHQKIIHKDIKPKNIIFSSNDSNFSVVDFGFARHYDSSKIDEQTVERTEYMDFPSIKSRDYTKNDMGQLALMLTDILDRVPEIRSIYTNHQLEAIQQVLNRAADQNLQSRFPTISHFYEALKQYFVIRRPWRLLLKRDEFLTPERFGQFCGAMKIPAQEYSVLFTKEVKQLIDSKPFQRLKGVKQLGPTFEVYPGTNHTRFEHTMGVYDLALKFLEKLVCIPEFRTLTGPVDKTIKLTILSALLHDIGHYPYSHWIEEIKVVEGTFYLPTHEKRVAAIIEKTELKEMLSNVWKVEVEELYDIINENSVHHSIITSIINSLMDIDKIDYLRRDSHHAGVPYGLSIDIPRLLDSLYVDKDNKCICLTEKGRSVILAILNTRNILYQELYWHKTVRASEAMFKKMFYEYIKSYIHKGVTNNAISDMLNELFDLPDDVFMNRLYTWALKYDESLLPLCEPFVYGSRALYKPVYIYYGLKAIEPEPIANFFSRVVNTRHYNELLVYSENLTNVIRKYVPEIRTHDLIVEKTPVKDESDKLLRIFNTRKGGFEPHPAEINNMMRYLSENRRAYIFCSPKIYDELTDKVFKKPEVLKEVIHEVNTL